MKKTSAFHLFKIEKSTQAEKSSQFQDDLPTKGNSSNKMTTPSKSSRTDAEKTKRSSIHIDTPTPANSFLFDTDKDKHKNSVKKMKSLLEKKKKSRPSLDNFLQSPFIKRLNVSSKRRNTAGIRVDSIMSAEEEEEDEDEKKKEVVMRSNKNNSSSHVVAAANKSPSSATGNELRNGTLDTCATSNHQLTNDMSGNNKQDQSNGSKKRKKKNKQQSSEDDVNHTTKRPRVCETEIVPTPPERTTSLIVKQKDLDHSCIVYAQKSNEKVPQSIDKSPANKTKAASKSSKIKSKPNSSLPAPLPFQYDSLQEANQIFERLIEPVTQAKFFKDIWEKKPLFIRRHDPEHNADWFSTAELDSIIRTKRINYTENLDIVSYTDGVRETHNPAGRAYPAVVWDYYRNGCSVRLLNPQTYSTNVWHNLSLLQEYFGCVAGANIYLTPPDTQGFAPHYDDIEAFVCQLEGKKRWRVYEPRTESETLPRFSSGNYTDADLDEPVLDIELNAGDLLYFPRGFIHQGNTLDGQHSLHITVSVGQKNSWGDLLEKLVPRALEVALEEDIDFRRSLPRDCFNYMGVAFSDTKQNHSGRASFLKTIDSLMTRLKKYAPIDSACDQLAKRFLEDSLPPHLVAGENQHSIHSEEAGARWNPTLHKVTDIVAIESDTEIRIIRSGSIRLVTEDSVCIYHNLENARVYHGAISKCMEVDSEMAEAVEFLINAYPSYVAVDKLPLDSLERQILLAADLYERGLVVTRRPLLESHDDSGDSN